MFRWLLTLIALAPAAAQDAPLWMRYPTISPDGQTVLFTYKGDIYRVDADGGLALPVTFYDGHDARPVWSRDGRHIAFASDRYGNMDIFVMPAEGGAATRLTYHSAADYPADFSPDGKYVLFNSGRLDHAQNAQFPRMPETYRVPIDGGRVEMVSTIAMDEPHYDPAGKRIVYQDQKGYENAWRKRHTSSVTRDIWIHDIERGAFTRLVDRPGEDRSPVFAADGDTVYYLSEQGGSFNLFKTSVGNPGQRQRLTNFSPHPVRFLTISNQGLLCFGHHGEIYTMREGGQPQKLAVQIYRGEQGRAEELVKVTSGAREFAVSPNGKELAFVYRGEVFVTSVETNVTKQVTRTPEQERSVSFSPDGRAVLYAGERGESWNLYQTKLARAEEKYFFNATVLEEEPILVSEAETFQPSYSPDGKEVAYLEARATLKVINLETKETRTVLAGDKNVSYADGDQDYQWSPDGKWFLVQFLNPTHWFTEIGLVAADGKSEPVNLTKSGFYDYQPKWMMDGKMLLWFSDRHGLRSYAGSGPSEGDAYAMFFTQEAYDRFKLSKEEYELLKEKEKEDKEKEKEADKKKDDKDKKKKDKKKKGDKDADKPELKPVKIELAGIEDRKEKLTIHSSRLTDAVVTPDGEKLLYLTRFEKGYDLWVTNLRDKETKILAKLGGGPGAVELDKKGKRVFLLANGRLSHIEISSGKRKNVAFSGEMQLDRAAERAYLYEHVWRQVLRKFYDPELHQAEWGFLKPEYARFLPHINNNYDFAELLSELLGELNASHTGGRYRHQDGDGDQTASLGVFFDPAYNGAGLKILEVMPKSPVAKSGGKIKAGVVIEKIDGVAIEPGMNHYPLLNRKAGKNTLLSLLDPESGTRWDETVQPVSRGRQNQLLYERWVEGRRKKVEALSGGRIGYVHVRGMNDSSYRTVFEEAMGEQVLKEALVVDTRFNGGGDLVEDLATFLSGRTYMDFVPQDGRIIGREPQRKWRKPSIVIAGEGNYSDAHCFPWAYKELGLGKVVGMPVPGTCTFVWWERLQDPSLVFGIPNMGVRGPDGVMLENSQLEPDIRVDNGPAQLAAGEDPQLEAAVSELLSQLGG